MGTIDVMLLVVLVFAALALGVGLGVFVRVRMGSRDDPPPLPTPRGGDPRSPRSTPIPNLADVRPATWPGAAGPPAAGPAGAVEPGDGVTVPTVRPRVADAMVGTDTLAPWDASAGARPAAPDQAAPRMVHTVDIYGTLVACSDAEARLLGYSVNQLVGRSLFDLAPPDQEKELRAHLEQAKRSVGELEGEFRLVSRGGALVSVLLHSRPLFDRSKQVIGVRQVLTDLSSRLAREELLERATQALAEKNAILALKTQEIMRINRNRSEFISSVSHELRTPLHAVIGYAELLGRGLYGPLNEKQQKAVDGIVDRGNDLLELINNILDLSRIEMGRLQLELTRFDPVSVLKEVIQTAHLLQRQAEEAMEDEEFADESFDQTYDEERDTMDGEDGDDGPAVELRTQLVDAPSEVAGDRNRYKQIVLNLVSNALRYTEEGHVDVVCRRETDGTFVTAVSDTGVGITPEDQESVFEAFYQVEASATRIHGGTGLGLPIARKLTEQMGGRLTVLSRLGVGSTFYLRLPMQGARLEDDQESSPFEQATVTGLHLPQRQAPTLLVVGDEGPGYVGIKEGLREEGMELYEARSPTEGFDLIRRRLPTAIVQLLSAPDDKPGDLVALVRGDPLCAHVPIVIVGPALPPQELHQLQVDEYLTVPTDGVEVAERVWPLIGKREDRVLLVGTAQVLETLSSALRFRGYSVARAARGARAEGFLQRSAVQMVVLTNDLGDVSVPDLLAAVDALQEVKRPNVVVILREPTTAEERDELRERAMALLDPGQLTSDEIVHRVVELLSPLDEADAGLSDAVEIHPGAG